jgi:hypothetical protein
MAEPEKQLEPSAFEPRDIGEGFIWSMAGVCLAVIAGCALLVMWLYPQALSERITSAPLPEFPAPRLQADPAADMRRFHAQELQQLSGGAHIPIDTAMRQIAAEGIADWPPP